MVSYHSTATACIACVQVPFSAIPAETIHPKQRGMYFMIAGTMMAIST